MNIRQNKTGRLLLCMAALTAWLFSACDDTMGGSTTTVPQFPTDTLTFVANPGDTVEVPFCAAVNWKLSSNKDWCRTADDFQQISGKSGKQTIPFVISDKGHGFADDKAEITLWMNNESRVIACVTRRAKGYFMELSSDSCMYATGESIILGTSGNIALNIQTNFGLDQLRMSYPEWLKPTRNGEEIVLQVVKDSVKYTINNPKDSLILFKSDNTFSHSYHVQYVGMDRRELHITPQIEADLIVSRDAKRCHVGDTEYTAPLTFTVEALNDGYQLVTVAFDEEKGCSILSDEDRWFVVEDNGCGTISLSFADENNGDERMAYLLALPQAVVDSLDACAEGYEAAMGNFLWEKVDGKTDLKETAQKFRLIRIAQDGVMNISISPETRWNLIVSTDGKTYRDAIRGDSLEAPVEATITTYRGYKLMCASYDSKVGCTIMEIEDSWISVDDNKQGDVKVYFKANTGNERILYLFALPLPLVESLEPESSVFHANLSEELFEDVEGLLELREKTEQFVIAKFAQEANEENAIKVLKKGVESVEVVKETEQEWLDIAAAKGVAAAKVFRCSMRLGYMYQINPLLSLDLWDVANDDKDRVEIYGKSGKMYQPGKGNDYIAEYTMMEETEGDHMLVQLTANGYDEGDDFLYYINEDFIMYFIDSETNYLKALVITRL